MASIYVGNLNYNSTEEEIKQLFEKYGEVDSVKIIMDRQTGRSRGFAFVEMDDSNAGEAIEKLNGENFLGRDLRVNEARRKEDSRPPRQNNGGWGGNNSNDGGFM